MSNYKIDKIDLIFRQKRKIVKWLNLEMHCVIWQKFETQMKQL